MSNTPLEETEAEGLADIYYSEYLTLIAGKKYFDRYPAFESIGISLGSNPCFVVTCKDQSGFAFLVSVLEPLNKKYQFSMWTPREAVTRNKMVFNFYTHNNNQYVVEFLKLLGCEDLAFVDGFICEFNRPSLCQREPVYFERLRENCSEQNILSYLHTQECDSATLQTLFNHYILLSTDLDELYTTIKKFAQLAMRRKMFRPIKSLVGCGLNILSTVDDFPPLLTTLSDHLNIDEAVELLQFSLRHYVSEFYYDCVIKIIELCEIHQISVDQPDLLSGKTALHWACIKDYHEIRELLIKAGANTTIKDDFGKTPDMYLEEHKDSTYESSSNLR